MIARLSLVGLILVALFVCTWAYFRDDTEEDDPEDWDDLIELEKSMKARGEARIES